MTNRIPLGLPPYKQRQRCIQAGVDIWAARGQQAVTLRAVGAAIGLTGARVHQLWQHHGGVTALREACRNYAVAVNNKSVLAQIEAGKGDA